MCYLYLPKHWKLLKNAPISVPKPDFPADDPTIEIDVEYETSDNPDDIANQENQLQWGHQVKP